ncbi:MAG: alanine racemase [Clostridiales bacterium]|nr:alanine racemase [Clostridiales bacterium]
MQTVVDLSRLRHNVRTIKNKTGNMFCAVVKSDAYGHGAAVAKYIEPLVDSFMVANYQEAETIRSLGVNKRIYVLGGELTPHLTRRDPLIIPTVFDTVGLSAVIRNGVDFSIEVNTGMNRLGAGEKALAEMKSICIAASVSPVSVYSHIYNGISSALEQSDKFEYLTLSPVFRRCRHLYSSCALDFPGVNLFDMTRAGIAMYGYYGPYVSPCMKVRAKIVAINLVHKGEHVGYGDYLLEKDKVIATVACGYGDGLRRCDKPLYMTVRGKKCPVIGVPCMDLTMIDVTGISPRVGEYAYLIAEKEDAEYLAKCYNTIVYEVLTGFNGRNERIYV